MIAPRVVAILNTFSKTASLVVIVIGMLVLAGWVADVETLKAVLPGYEPMKVNTSIGFIFGGLSLWLLLSRSGNRTARIVAGILAFFVVVIGSLTLLEYLTWREFGIDNLIFADPDADMSGGFAGRMSPLSAVNFTILGAALLILITRPGKEPYSGVLALVAAFASLLSVLGYIYGVAAFYTFYTYSSVALNTAIASIVLALGILFVRPERGIMSVITMDTLGGMMARRVLPWAILLPFFFGWLRLKGQELGYYDTGIGLSLFAVSTMVLFTLLIWFSARSLNGSDIERKQAENEVHLLNQGLERRVVERTHELQNAINELGREVGERHKAEDSLKVSLEELSRKNRMETIINAITGSVHGSVDLREVLSNAVKSIKENMPGVDFIGVFMIEDKNAVLMADSGYPEDVYEKIKVIPYPKGLTWKTVEEGKTMYCPDAENDTTIGQAGRALGTKSYISMPIRYDEKTVGVININSRTADAFDKEELSLLETVAIQVEAAVHNARIVEALRATEKENRSLNEELERRLEELTAVNKELEAFSYSVSHDLRAPLRAIDGFSRILLEDYSGMLDEEGHRLFSVIRSNTLNMGQLIDDLLAFSRLGRQDVVPLEVNISEMARQVFQELQPHDSVKTPKFTLNHLPTAFGDRSMIRQVLTNLISNAIKFTRDRGAEAAIEITGHSNGRENIYHITDNGIGFDMAYVDKLFGVFQRLHSQNEFEGTGVGLALVKRIVVRHGGRVWAEGKVGEGASFYFTLPKDEGGLS
jgi:signal transduction histidine kinase